MQLEKVCKKGAFWDRFCGNLGPKRGRWGPTNWVQNTLNHDERCLFIIQIGFNANGALHGHHLGTQIAQKNGIFWQFLTDFKIDVRHLRIPFPAATIGFLAQTLCNCTSHPWVSSTKISPKSKARRRSSEFFPLCACCCLLLLAACLLACLLAAAAKPGRSTLDTKKGYKTKTGSTSSVTKTEYWVQACGERNITFKAFWDFRRGKIAYNGIKEGSFHLFVHPKRSSYHFGKTRF